MFQFTWVVSATPTDVGHSFSHSHVFIAQASMQQCSMIIGTMNKGMDVKRTNNRQPSISRRSQPNSGAHAHPKVNAMQSWMKENVVRILLEEICLAPKTPIIVMFDPQPSPMRALESRKV